VLGDAERDCRRLTGSQPYLLIDGAAQAIEWYEKALGARERYRLAMPDHTIAHAELELGDSVLMLCDPLPQFEGRPPTALGSTSVQVFMYVEDVDAAVKRAVEAGATRATKVADQFWGDRLGTITDPFGHVWVLATRMENLTPEEIMERARAAAARMGSD
jgi:PhnB protein